MPEFTQPPQWEWLVVIYLFAGGLAAGLFVLGALIRWFGRENEQPAARLAFLASLPITLVCPVVLTAHLGQPSRFWHMLINVSEGTPTFVKFWSPMPLGAWALTLFGGCSGLMFLNQVVTRPQMVTATAGGGPAFGGSRRGLLPATLENVVLVIGFGLGVFVMGYTGVLLSVSNQPIWSESWILGGLFTASSLASATAILILLLWFQRRYASVIERLAEAATYFIILDLVALAIMTFTASHEIQGAAGWVHLISFVLEVVALLLLAPTAFRLKIPGISDSRRLSIVTLAALLLPIAGFLLRYSIVYAIQP